jgi:hypothetical protein
MLGRRKDIRVVTYLIIGSIGLLLLGLSAVLHDLLDGVLDSLSLDFGGFVSTPTIAAFAAALGFGGAMALYAGAGPVAAAAIGTGAGVGIGAIAGFVTRTLIHSATDPTPRVDDAVGMSGAVVSPIPAGGYGEVRVHYDGQMTKLNAVADVSLPAGAAVVVVAVLSPTAVKVAAAQTG